MEKQTTENENMFVGIMMAILVIFIAWLFIDSQRSSRRFQALKEGLANGQNGDAKKLEEDISNVGDNISKSYQKAKNSYAT